MSDQHSEGTPEPLSIKEVMNIKNYRWLWLSQVVSNVGDALTRIALVLLVNAQTNGSTSSIAGLMIASVLPTVLIGLIAGAYVDRWPRKRVMISAELIQMVLMLVFVAYTFITAPPLWLIYLIAFLSATAGAFFMPARMAIIPRIVPENGLMAANSLGQVSRITFGVLGTALGGFLVGVLGQYSLVFAIDAVTFLLSPLLIWQVAIADDTGSQSDNTQTVLSDIQAGFGIVAGDRILVGVLFGFAMTMLGAGAMNVLLPPLVVNELQVSETWFGAIELAQTVAMVLSGLMVTRLAARFKNTSIVVGSLLGLGAVAYGFALVASIWHLFIVLFGAGLAMSPLQSAAVTIVQSRVDKDAMGRVGGALNALIESSSLISMFAAGFIADQIGIAGVFLGSGTIICLAAVIAGLIFRSGDAQP